MPLLKVGETKTLRLNVRVTNLAEDAHESSLICVLPDGVEYTNVDTGVGKVRQKQMFFDL